MYVDAEHPDRLGPPVLLEMGVGVQIRAIDHGWRRVLARRVLADHALQDCVHPVRQDVDCQLPVIFSAHHCSELGAEILRSMIRAGALPGYRDRSDRRCSQGVFEERGAGLRIFLSSDAHDGIMRSEHSHARRRAPWHLWAVGVVALLIFSAGAYDHVMALSENAAYFKRQNYDVTQIAYFTDYPVLPAIFWTIGVWGSLVASILLLLRRRWAVIVAVIGLAGQVMLDIISFGFMHRWRDLGARLAMFDLCVLLLSAAFVCYGRVMAERGVLR